MPSEQSASSPLLIDLSHTIEHGLITYKGLPAPIICDFMSREQSRKHYAAGTEFQIGKIEMVANTGTYLDSPFHRYAEGKDLSQLELSKLANLPGVKVSCLGRRAVDASQLRGMGPLKGKAVLIETGWSRHWNTPQYFEGHSFLTADAAEFLADSGVSLVGIDSLNIDDIQDGRRPVHSTLLGREILIVEHMTNLAALNNQGFVFSAVPPKVRGFGTFPVRAFAVM
jgi:kynurenine formamidase